MQSRAPGSSAATRLQVTLSRRSLLGAAAVACVGVIASACGSSPAPTATSGATASTGRTTPAQAAATPSVVGKKTTLTIGIGGDAPGLNVLENNSAPVYSAYFAGWDPWMIPQFTPQGALQQIKPMLMTDWKVISDDKLTWQFKLREGVTFHNGEPWDADAAAFNVNYIMSSKTSNVNPRSNLLVNYDSVQAVDKYTLNLKTKVPFVITPRVFEEFFMAPPQYFQSAGAEAFATKPVGIGQYRFVEWRKSERIVFERNPNYWGDPATFDTLVFKPLAEDATRVAALEAGEIDLAYNVPPDDAKRLAGKGLQISWAPIGQAMNLTMKLTIKSPLTDKRVRQAMNYALDKDSLVKDVMVGYAVPLEGQIVGPSSTGFNPDVKAYPYDPAKAKQLLADAGFPDGFSVDFDTSQGRYSKQKEVSEWMVGEFAKVGIKLNMHLYEWTAFTTKNLSDQAVPCFYTGRNWYPMMDDQQCINMFASTEPRKQMNEPAYDQLYKAQQTAFDANERKGILNQIHAYLHDYAPVVWLFQSPDIYGHTKRLRNFTPTPDDIVHLFGVSLADA